MWGFFATQMSQFLSCSNSHKCRNSCPAQTYENAVFTAFDYAFGALCVNWLTLYIYREDVANGDVKCRLENSAVRVAIGSLLLRNFLPFLCCSVILVENKNSLLKRTLPHSRYYAIPVEIKISLLRKILPYQRYSVILGRSWKVPVVKFSTLSECFSRQGRYQHFPTKKFSALLALLNR